MGKKLTDKSFCKWEKDDIKNNIATILDLTAEPRYICEKCARVAKNSVNVCKPFEVGKGCG